MRGTRFNLRASRRRPDFQMTSDVPPVSMATATAAQPRISQSSGNLPLNRRPWP
jgi:hypothetical protein